MSYFKVVFFVLATVFFYTGAIADQKIENFSNAEKYFQSQTQKERLTLQINLIAAGYFGGIPSQNFSSRLFQSLQKFQSENGFDANGALDISQSERLSSLANKWFLKWGFKKVSHPARGYSVWVPFGLGLQGERDSSAINYADPEKRIYITFATFPESSLSVFYAAFQQALLNANAKIHSKVLNKDFYIISASEGGIDKYIRYQRDAKNVTGFSLLWNNSKGNVEAVRIAILMSASLRSHSTIEPYIEPPSGNTAPSEPKSFETAKTEKPPTATKAAPNANPKDGIISSGTGFFVTRDGVFVTNAHVVKDCKNLNAKTDDGKLLSVRIVSTDPINDLALLSVDFKPAKISSIKVGIRLGEPIAAFGFPLSQTLSSSGNFTLGNVTALSGIADDTRFLQISAPVQPGNSGGPLLDNSGNLVGVVTSKLNVLQTLASSGDIPQNVNFAVKASAVTAFLESNRVVFENGTATTALSAPDLADHARRISVFVTCTL